MYRNQTSARNLLNKFVSFTMDCALNSMTNQSRLNNLKFDNKALRCLPLDKIEQNYIRTVNNAIYSLIKPTPIKNPKLVAYSRSALQLIDLNESDVDDEFVLYFCGNKLLQGSQTASQCYAGHQFGSFVGQLGDGAVIYLGEIVNSKNQRYELQLKGAGMTPFCRGADGRKVLRSSIREFLCSEAMHHLGIPTTRAATCITSDDFVTRDIYYDGNEISERCTVISRIAETFIRFGTFEIFKTRDEITGRFGPSVGRTDILEKLFDYVIETFYPAINEINELNSDKSTNSSQEVNTSSRGLKCREFFKEIVKRTAKTCALWQSYFFTHGVLNSDNMSIIGLTLDYGPFGFMEKFDHFYVCNGSDHNARYSFINQPTICRWNLWKLAEMLAHFTSLDELLTIQEQHFIPFFKQVYFDKMRSKFGLFNELSCEIDNVASDEKLVHTFLECLESTGSDVTNGFRNLNLVRNINDNQSIEQQINEYINLMMNENSLLYGEMKKETRELFSSMNIQYYLTLMEESPENLKILAKTSDKIKSFLSFIERYEKTKNLSKAEKVDWDRKKWQSFFDIYVRRIKYDLKDKNMYDDKVLESRIKLMNSNNPKFILRNHLAQRAIQEAESGGNDEINRLIKLIERPYDENVLADDKSVSDSKIYYRMPRKEERCKKITCSS